MAGSPQIVVPPHATKQEHRLFKLFQEWHDVHVSKTAGAIEALQIESKLQGERIKKLEAEVKHLSERGHEKVKDVEPTGGADGSEDGDES